MTTTDHTTDVEYLALLEAIRTNPADDAPRLILSDWLEEHGEDERAAWIRHEVKHQRQPIIIVSDMTIGATRLDEHKVLWSRGFAQEVRLSCREFMGGPCERCHGSGMLEAHSFRPPCRLCSGTGRIPGVARELFERHPLTRIILTCRKPLRTNIQHGNLNYWWRMAPTATTELPGSEDIPDILRKFFVSRISGGLSEYLGFNTEAAALSALSDACVRYGRELVGLPPLS